MKKENSRKEYVQVLVIFTPDGKMIPKAIELENGRRFSIDQIMDIKRAVQRRPGQPQLEFTCRIWGQDCSLYYEDNCRWFTMMKAS